MFSALPLASLVTKGIWTSDDTWCAGLPGGATSTQSPPSLRAPSLTPASALTPADPRWVTALRSIVKGAMPERLSTAIWRSKVGAVFESTSPLTTIRPANSPEPTRGMNSESIALCR